MQINPEKENSYTSTWKANFKKEVEGIQIEYDAFFLNRKLEDYFYVREDESNHTLTLLFHDTHSLPKPVEKALEMAFIKSKPQSNS